MNRHERRAAEASAKHPAPVVAAPRPSLFVAMPCNRCVDPTTVGALIGLSARLTREGIDHRFLFHAEGTIELARAELVEHFVASSESHLLFLDSDVSCAPDVVMRMLACNRPLVCCTYPARRPGRENKMWISPTEGSLEALLDTELAADGTIRISGTGLGLTLVTREAIERMRAHYAAELTAVAEHGSPRTVVRLFDHLRWNGAVLGEDFSFFARASAIGIEPRLLVDAEVSHAHTAPGFQQTWTWNFRHVWEQRRSAA